MLHTTKSRLFGAFAIALLASSAEAQIAGETKRNVVVARGSTVLIASRGFMDQRFCQNHPTSLFRIYDSKPPTLGKLSSRNEVEKIPANARGFGHGNCVGTEVPVTRVYFQAGAQPGRETFQFFLMGPVSYQYDVTVEVR